MTPEAAEALCERLAALAHKVDLDWNLSYLESNLIREAIAAIREAHAERRDEAA